MGASVLCCFILGDFVVVVFLYTKPFSTLASLQSEPKMGHSVVSGINTSNLILELKKLPFNSAAEFVLFAATLRAFLLSSLLAPHSSLQHLESDLKKILINY